MAVRASTSEWGRHVRAALELREMDTATAAREINRSVKTLLRTIGGERKPTDWETLRLAELLNVPESFLRDGLTDSVVYRDRAARNNRLDQVQRLIRELQVEEACLQEELLQTPDE